MILIYVSAFFGIFSSLVYFLTLYENRSNIKDPKPNKFLSVSVIVPAFNEDGRIKRTVDSLLKLNYPKNLLEIILVDDGSKDNTLKEMQSYSSEKQIKIFSKNNGGKASALNLGIKNAKGEIVVSLDADSFVDKNALMNMIGYFNNPKVMAVTPSMKVWKPKNWLQKIQFIEYMFGIYLRKAAAFLGCIHVTPGPFSAYRKSFFQKYGGYKEGNLTEDIEVALRIQSNNFIIENSANAHSYTVAPSGFDSLFRQRLRWYVGFLNNVWDYKHLFSRKYGTLGLFYLPSAFLSIIFITSMVFYSLKILFTNTYSWLINIRSIDFDIFKLINFKIDWFYFTPNIVVLMTILSILIALIAIYIARVISKDKEKIASRFLWSALLYGYLYTLWWLVSFAYKATGKKVTWSGMTWKKD